jgi:hypothetical protein
MALTIFCDESGFSGNNLFLDKDRHFVYASVAIANDEAVEIVKKIRTDSRTKADELKFEKLGDTPRGREAVRWFLEMHGEKVGIFHADKKYATAGKFFECVFEPVLRPRKPLFYDILLHRFVSMLIYDAWAGGDQVATELLQDGQDLVRGKKQPHDLQRLLREPLHRSDGDDLLTAITAFSYAYRSGILRELKDVGTDPEETAPQVRRIIGTESQAATYAAIRESQHGVENDHHHRSRCGMATAILPTERELPRLRRALR